MSPDERISAEELEALKRRIAWRRGDHEPPFITAAEADRITLALLDDHARLRKLAGAVVESRHIPPGASGVPAAAVHAAIDRLAEALHGK